MNPEYASGARAPGREATLCEEGVGVLPADLAETRQAPYLPQPGDDFGRRAEKGKGSRSGAMRHVVVGLGEVDLGPRLAGRGKPRRRGGHSATLTPRVGGQRRERLEEQGAPRAQENGTNADRTGIFGVALGYPNDTTRQTLTQRADQPPKESRVHRTSNA